MRGFQNRLDRIVGSKADIVSGGLKGIEKESLRVSGDGELSQLTHPQSLGSALTNRYITTDFSEALLEFVTPAFPTTWEALHCVCGIHQFTYSKLRDEMLWAASMPCVIPSDDRIPLARYGKSNVGKMKTIYRRGLGFRYGRQMQTIAGVHFNYSVPEHFWPAYQALLKEPGDADAFRSKHYLAMVRNVRRMGWMMLYLFGNSPAICRSFVAGNTDALEPHNDDTFYAPYGTSLRMSDLGYSNQNQSRINISLNSLDDYVEDLSRAIETPEPDYLAIGVKVDGSYRQLNANLLQIENEFYSSVRPKRVAHSGERPTAALRRGGIEYVEIRSLDISLFDPCGINQNSMRFMEAFLLYCLIADSAELCEEELTVVNTNQTAVARMGRDPEFFLQRDGRDVRLTDWANEILAGVDLVAAELDRRKGDNSYRDAIAVMQGMVDDPSLLPSARIVSELTDNDVGFAEYALDVSRRHRDYFASIALPGENTMQRFEDEAEESIKRQKAIEESDAVSLDEYLAGYFGSSS